MLTWFPGQGDAASPALEADRATAVWVRALVLLLTVTWHELELVYVYLTVNLSLKSNNFADTDLLLCSQRLTWVWSALWEIYSILKCGKGDKKCESPYRDVISWLWRLLWQSPQHISKCVVAVFLFFFLWPLALRNVTRETETSIEHRRKCVSADFCIQICYQTQNEFLPSRN